MNEEGVNSEGTNQEVSKTASVDAKIAGKLGVIDRIINNAIGFIGNRPWEKWFGACNDYITKGLPLIVGTSGAIAFILALCTAVSNNLPVSIIFACLAMLLITVFSVHLTPKALALLRSLVEKGEPELMRPEYIYICKVVSGLGGLILALFLLLQFSAKTFIPAIGIAVYAVLSIIVYSKPSLFGVKEGYPQNCAEEYITLIMFPVKVILALSTILIGIAVAIGFVCGVIAIRSNGLGEGIIIFFVTALIPFVAPLVIYFAYLLLMFCFEAYRAMVSIPRRLESLQKALSDRQGQA